MNTQTASCHSKNTASAMNNQPNNLSSVHPSQSSTQPSSSSHSSTSTSSTSLSSMSSLSSESPDIASAESLKLVIVCVGLPARGKSYITKKLQKYFNWSQFNTKIFNVGNTRRHKHTGPSKYPVLGPTAKNTATTTTHNANFFDSSNKKNFQIREKWAKETLDQLLDFLLYEGGNVGIFDATNTTKQRRRWITQTVTNRMNGMAKVLFLESICTDNELIEKNIHLKLLGPDYKKMDREMALRDFRHRLQNYEKVYETIDATEEHNNEKNGIQYVKIINAGKKIISYNISGYLSSQCVFFLMNFNLTDRQIWLTTNGESENNAGNILGGDSDLSANGWKFARALPRFISKKREEFRLRELNKKFIKDSEFSSFNNKPQVEQKFNIWTSTLKRTNETTQYFSRGDYRFKAFKMLNDIGCGSLDSTPEGDFRKNHFPEYKEMLQHRLSNRFPGLGGESYLDVIARLRPMIVELERLKDHVLIVSHRVIIRVLLCYFMNLSKEMMTELDVKHGYVYCIEPKPYGLALKMWQYDDITDDFYEVDEIELMQRKRKRFSISLGDNFRPILKKDQHGSSSSSVFDDDKSSDSEGETIQAPLMDIKQYQKIFCGRSDSQCYEFANESSSSHTNNVPMSCCNSVNVHSIRMSSDENSIDPIDAEVARIMQNEELVKRLRKVL